MPSSRLWARTLGPGAECPLSDRGKQSPRGWLGLCLGDFLRRVEALPGGVRLRGDVQGVRPRTAPQGEGLEMRGLGAR